MAISKVELRNYELGFTLPLRPHTSPIDATTSLIRAPWSVARSDQRLTF